MPPKFSPNMVDSPTHTSTGATSQSPKSSQGAQGLEASQEDKDKEKHMKIGSIVLYKVYNPPKTLEIMSLGP